MIVKKHVRLNYDAYIDWGCITSCKCGRRIIFNKDDFEPNENVHCKECGHMVIAVCSDGVPYYVGEKVYPDAQKWAPQE